MNTFLRNAVYNPLAFVSGALLGILLALIAIVSLSRWVEAATYNVFFNNVEQGPNSHATPTLNIQGNAPVAVASPAPAAPAAPVVETPIVTTQKAPEIVPPASPAPVSSSHTELAQAPLADPGRHRKFRLSLLGEHLSHSRELSDVRDNERKWTGALQASYFPLRDLGMSAMTGQAAGGGAYYGGELELVPVRVGLLGLENLVEGSLVGGATTQGRSDDRWGTVHAGAKLTANLGDRFGLTGAVRTNITGRREGALTVASLGLSVKF